MINTTAQAPSCSTDTDLDVKGQVRRGGGMAKRKLRGPLLNRLIHWVKLSC
jgi:hypothetical protein